MMTMKNHMQFLGGAFAAMLCAALVTAPALAGDAATGGSGGDASHAEGVGDARFNGPEGGDHGSANRSRASDTSHSGVAAHDGSGAEAGRAAAPASAPGLIRPSPDDLGPIRVEGFTGPQRRANRNPLIVLTPQIPGRPPAAIGVGAPFVFSGANGGTGRRTSVAVPGASGSAFGTPSLGRNAPDLKASAAIGTNTIGSPAAAATAGPAWHRPGLPSGAVTAPPPHAAVISGTTVSHIASGPGYVGGPAKDRSGINGTAIRPKL